MLLDFGQEVGVVLELSRELQSQDQVTHPLLSDVPMFARVYFVVRLFDHEVHELLFHMPRFLFLRNDLDALHEAQRGYFLGLLGVVFLGLVANQGALEGVNKQVPVFEGHKGSFGFQDHASENGGERDGQISSDVLVVTLPFLLVLLE